ncbi:all trans-polyprenyl-diphosphate synthase PDSS2 isoform X2 [Solenopsis invicta]|uniref:all trans-polyprenyl-diphosphate synthase PDSS2 isoform X2 n=1 Tax=Solenopsis invicta TaxID=13686 RepID=UPI00193CF71F|nr:all trans-polyprenyl-diphosphate synthase PDSS2 isoform X2 [Solenopsis invicta]
MHPALKTVKSITNNTIFGLILILFSKAGHLPIQENKAADVIRRQMKLATVMELLYANNNMINKGIFNTLQTTKNNRCLKSSELKNITFSNKIALLFADDLLRHALTQLADLKNQDIFCLMMSAMADFCQIGFIGRKDKQGFPIPPIPLKDRTDYAVTEWTLLNIHVGSLFAKSCQSTLKIAGHNKEMEENGFEFGKHLALAWQNLCAAPIMFHVEHDPSILIELEKGLESVENVDYLKVLEIVAAGPGIGLTKTLVREHSQKAKKILGCFKESNTREALFDIIAAINNFE